MVFLQLLHHALATAVKPSLTNPLALIIGLGGLAMAVTMVLAARSFTRLERERPERAGPAPVRPQVPPRQPSRSNRSSKATREAKTVV
jgi:hypothetical protein